MLTENMSDGTVSANSTLQASDGVSLLCEQGNVVSAAMENEREEQGFGLKV